LADFLKDTLKLWKAFWIRIAGVFGFNSIWRHVPARPYFGPLKSEIQAELSLDNVTVVRNDLNDAEFRLSPMPNVNTNQGNIQSPDLVVNMGPVNAALEAIKTRFLRVPIGYQDESGFHRGEIMAKKEIGWPPFW
jgi:hypothetical protein